MAILSLRRGRLTPVGDQLTDGASDTIDCDAFPTARRVDVFVIIVDGVATTTVEQSIDGGTTWVAVAGPYGPVAIEQPSLTPIGLLRCVTTGLSGGAVAAWYMVKP